MGGKHKNPVPIPGGKGNPLLNKIAAFYEQREIDSLRYAAEVDRMALMKLLHDKFQVGPGRAMKYLNDYMEIKNSIPESLLAESKDDPEALVFKRNWAVFLKSVFGKNWEGCKLYFSYLRQYW